MVGILAFFYIFKLQFITGGSPGNIGRLHGIKLGYCTFNIGHPYYLVVHRYLA
jgi:hypothetical protein